MTIDNESRAEALTDFMEGWYDRNVDPDYVWVARDLADAIVEWQASRKVEAASSDTDRESAHAEFHCESGNMLGEKDCEWEGCQFWEVATFLAERTSQPVPSDTEKQFCDECSGPYSGWLADQYGGHWDTCPNRHSQPVQVEVTDDRRRQVAAILVSNGIKPHNPAYYNLIVALAALGGGE